MDIYAGSASFTEKSVCCRGRWYFVSWTRGVVWAFLIQRLLADGNVVASQNIDNIM